MKGYRLNTLEQSLRRFGLVAAIIPLASIFWGIGRGLRRPIGKTSGQAQRLLGSPLFFLLATVGYFGLCWRLWRPLPLHLSPRLRMVATLAGTSLYVSGLVLVLWGRLALGKMYFVSTSFGARLYADHRLVTHGPFALLRHPMYLGLNLMAAGGILLYRTWTFVFVLSHCPALVLRARREEAALAAQFGAAWTQYTQRVPAWFPRLQQPRCMGTFPPD